MSCSASLSPSSQKNLPFFWSSVPGTLDLATFGEDDVNVLAKSRRVVITQGFRITESFPIAQQVVLGWGRNSYDELDLFTKEEQLSAIF